MWRQILRMYFSHRSWHVGIETGDEWNARGAAHPRRSNACNRKAEHDGERRDDPANTDFRRHLADSLYDSLKHTDVILADRDQKRQRCADIQNPGNKASPSDRARQSLLRITNLVSHHRRKFQSNQAEANYAKRVQDK